MQKLILKLSSFSLLLSLLFLTSCGEDPIIDIPNFNGPSVDLTTGTGLVSNDVDLDTGETFKVQLVANQGESPLAVLRVYEGGALIDASRLELNGAPAPSNTIAIIAEADKAGFTYDLTITGVPEGVTNYEFEVEDEDGNKESASVNVTGISGALAITLDQSSTIDGATPNSLVAVPVTVTRGGSPLNTLTVYEDGVAIADESRLAFKDAGDKFSDNPLTLSDDDKDGFMEAVYIRVNSGSKVYRIEVADEAGNIASTEVTINAGTPINSEFVAVLVSNADGPDEGGLDLYNGQSVPSASDAAQVRDRGINTDLDLADNWRQEVEAVNGASLRLPDMNQPEGFQYANVDTKEAIVAAYESGEAVAATGKLSEGDLFLIENNGDYFLIEVRTVSKTDADNKDFYEFNIKQALK